MLLRMCSNKRQNNSTKCLPTKFTNFINFIFYFNMDASAFLSIGGDTYVKEFI